LTVAFSPRLAIVNNSLLPELDILQAVCIPVFTAAMLSERSLAANTLTAQVPRPHYTSDQVSYGSHESDQHVKPYSTSEMTPPTTPNCSQEDLSPVTKSQPIFHNFLRAFYPFHPSYAISDSSVTLPLEEGDVVLVHSVHTNGWADGTLLVSGARGWLPTNYCEAYEPEDMRSLLKALLNFWDLLRSTSVNDSEIFRNQEFMKGIIAGVRFLLVGLGSDLPATEGLTLFEKSMCRKTMDSV
jgi:hypothetical protein